MLIKLGNGIFLNTNRIVSIEIVEPFVYEQYGSIPNGYSIVFTTDIINDVDLEECECNDSECSTITRNCYNYIYYVHSKTFTSQKDAESWILENFSLSIISEKSEMH